MKTSNKLLLIFFLIILGAIIAMMIYVRNGTEQKKGPGLTGNREVVEQQRKISSFEEIVIKDKIEVNFKQDSVLSLWVKTDRNLVDYLITEVKGNVLHVYMDKKVHRARKREVQLSAPVLNKISLLGGSQFNSENTLRVNYLDAKVLAGSQLNLQTDCQKLTTNFAAGSQGRFQGNVNILEIEGNAGSIVKAGDLVAETCDIDVNAGCIVEVHATKTLAVNASSGSIIRYSGKPAMEELDLSSGAQIKQD